MMANPWFGPHSEQLRWTVKPHGLPASLLKPYPPICIRRAFIFNGLTPGAALMYMFMSSV